MKYKIAAFFAGRNGFDALAKIIMWPSLILMLVSGFIPVAWLSLGLLILSWAGVIYAYFRVFSKNLPRREAENARYVNWRGRQKLRWQCRKTHRIYACPRCKAALRVPRGKGKISITCRGCGEKFIKTT